MTGTVGTEAPAAPGDEAPAWPLRRILPALMAICAMAALDQTVISIALPRIANELGRPTQLGSVIAAYMLASTATAPVFGRLSDLWGRKVVLASALGIFLAGSALCGLASSLWMLVAFRAVQGLGAGGLLPVVQAALADRLPPMERRRVQGLLSAVFGACSIAGPIAGGLLTQFLSWRWVFFVNLPVGLITLPAVLIGLPPGTRRPDHRVDGIGAAMLAASAVAVMLALDWPDPATRAVGIPAAVVAAALGIWGLLGRERRVADPFLPMFLYRTPRFRRLQVVIGLTSLALVTAAVFLPLYLQLVRGLSPGGSGLAIAPLMVGIVVASNVGGRLVFRGGLWKPPTLAGLTAAAASLGGLGVAIRLDAPTPVLLGLLALLGLGFGATLPNLMTAIQDTVERPTMGAAMSLTVLARAAGGVTGVALSSTILALWVGESDLAAHGTSQSVAVDIAAWQLGLSATFLAGAAFALVALGALLGLRGWRLAGSGGERGQRR